MNKEDTIQEILEVHKREKYIAGHVLRKYPVRRGHFFKDMKRDDLDIVYTLVDNTIDFNILTTRTSYNLYALNLKYGIDWFYIMKYRTESESPDERHAYIIYGMVDDNLVTYFRKETYSTVAGSTWMYFGNGSRIKVDRLIDLNWFNKPLANKKDVAEYIRQLKRLYQVMNNIEIEKIVLLHA